MPNKFTVATLAFTFGVMTIPSSAQNLPFADKQAYVCEFDRSSIKADGVEEMAISTSRTFIIAKKAAFLCDDESCTKFSSVGFNEGGSPVYISSIATKITTNVLALEIGAGIQVVGEDGKLSASFTGECVATTTDFVKASMKSLEID